QPGRRNRRALGHADDLDRQDALEQQVRLDGDRRHRGLLLSPDHLHFFSIRINCGRPEMTLSRCPAAKAFRTASSVVAYVIKMTGTGPWALAAPPAGVACRCTMDSIEMLCCARRLAMVAAVPGLSTASMRM